MKDKPSEKIGLIGFFTSDEADIFIFAIFSIIFSWPYFSSVDKWQISSIFYFYWTSWSLLITYIAIKYAILRKK